MQRELGVVSLSHSLSDLVRGTLLVVFRRHEKYRRLDLDSARDKQGKGGKAPT